MKAVMVVAGSLSLDLPLGGMTKHAHYLIKNLSESIQGELHIINVVHDLDKERAINLENLKNVYIHYIVKKNSQLLLINDFFILIKIIKKIKNINPDVLHIQQQLLGMIVLLLKHKYPTVCTVHSLVEYEWKYLEKKFGLNLISYIHEKLIIPKLNNIIVCSPAMKELIRKKTSANIFVIPNGIEKDILKKRIKNIKLSEPSILYIGRLEPYKGVDIVLKSIPIIKREIPNVRVFIAGTGDYIEDLIAMADNLNISEHINFLGYIHGDNKYEYIKSTDVCILPSLCFEHAPVILPEAMSQKATILASNIGGIPFLIKDSKTGILFTPGDYKELAKKTIILLNNSKLRKKLGESAYEKLKNLTWDILAKKTLSVYKEVIKNEKKP